MIQHMPNWAVWILREGIIHCDFFIPAHFNRALESSKKIQLTCICLRDLVNMEYKTHGVY